MGVRWDGDWRKRDRNMRSGNEPEDREWGIGVRWDGEWGMRDRNMRDGNETEDREWG